MGSRQRDCQEQANRQRSRQEKSLIMGSKRWPATKNHILIWCTRCQVLTDQAVTKGFRTCCTCGRKTIYRMHEYHAGERTKRGAVAIDQALAAALQTGLPPGREDEAVRDLKRVVLAWFCDLMPPRVTAWTVFGPDRQLLGYNQAIDEVETAIAEEVALLAEQDGKPG
jgi:hypothetical protein